MNIVEYLLTCLMEECAELQKDCAKALRFGLNDEFNETTPAENIAREFIDVVAVVQMLIAEKAIKDTVTSEAIQNKKDRVIKYMEYAKERGTLKIEEQEKGQTNENICSEKQHIK